MAIHPRAGALSLTAERWLKSSELRFCSRKPCTCWMALDTGCRRAVRTGWIRNRQKRISLKKKRVYFVFYSDCKCVCSSHQRASGWTRPRGGVVSDWRTPASSFLPGGTREGIQQLTQQQSFEFTKK